MSKRRCIEGVTVVYLMYIMSTTVAPYMHRAVHEVYLQRGAAWYNDKNSNEGLGLSHIFSTARIRRPYAL